MFGPENGFHRGCSLACVDCEVELRGVVAGYGGLAVDVVEGYVVEDMGCILVPDGTAGIVPVDGTGLVV